MAIIHGKDGVVKIGANDFAHVQSWNIDTTADVAEAYSMGDDWKDAGVGAGLRIQVTLGTGRGLRRGRLYPILRVFVWT